MSPWTFHLYGQTSKILLETTNFNQNTQFQPFFYSHEGTSSSGRLPKKEITEISEISEITLAKAVTSKNSIISKISIASNLGNFRNFRNFRNFCTVQNFRKYFSLSLRVLGNYGKFRNFLFWKSEHTLLWLELTSFKSTFEVCPYKGKLHGLNCHL
jgi:hypothetical protein